MMQLLYALEECLFIANGRSGTALEAVGSLRCSRGAFWFLSGVLWGLEVLC